MTSTVDPVRLALELDTLRAANKAQESRLIDLLSQMGGMMTEIEARNTELDLERRELQQANALLERMMHTMSDAFILADPGGRIVRANAAAMRRLPELAALPAITLEDVFPGDWLGDHGVPHTAGLPGRNRLHAALAANPTFEVELPVGRERRWHLVRGSVIHSPKGKEEGILILAADVSDLHERQDDLERTLLHALEQSPLEILISTPDGVIEYVNQRFAEQTGWSKEEAVGRKTNLVASGQTPPSVYREMWETLGGGNEWRGELLNRMRNGRLVWEYVAISPIKDVGGKVTHFLAMKEDFSSRRAAEERIRHLASHDQLTGLPNRAMFQEAMSSSLKESAPTALLFVDLDGFKDVNDMYGHAQGDALLRLVAQRLRAALPESAMIARIGGDEFAVLVTPGSIDDAVRYAGALLDGMRPVFVYDDIEMHTTASIGIAMSTDCSGDPDALLRNADIAMYRAKNSRDQQIAVFNLAMLAEAQWRSQVIEALRGRADMVGFSVHFQPKIRLSDGGVGGFEALIRWKHPTLGELSPDRFIPIAEQSGNIIQIGLWVVREACRMLCTWRDAGFRLVPVAVNVSAIQLHDEDFPDDVDCALREFGIPPDLLEIEVTETAALANFDLTRDILERFRQLGVRVALDDFGTGFSSLSYLQRLPIDVLKVDRSFVRSLDTKDESAVLVQGIVQLGRLLGKELIAEGVETQSQMRQLREWGCDYGQGYLFARPIAAEAVPGWWSRAEDRNLLE